MTPSRIASEDHTAVEATVRSVPEWIGATPDTPVPQRVKLRVFARHHGRCHLTGRKITPADLWDCDHVKSIIAGGENRESNLAPALRDKHRIKSAGEVTIKSKVDRIRAKHLGIAPPPTQKIKSRGFQRRNWGAE